MLGAFNDFGPSITIYSQWPKFHCVSGQLIAMLGFYCIIESLVGLVYEDLMMCVNLDLRGFSIYVLFNEIPRGSLGDFPWLLHILTLLNLFMIFHHAPFSLANTAKESTPQSSTTHYCSCINALGHISHIWLLCTTQIRRENFEVVSWSQMTYELLH